MKPVSMLSASGLFRWMGTSLHTLIIAVEEVRNAAGKCKDEPQRQTGETHCSGCWS